MSSMSPSSSSRSPSLFRLRHRIASRDWPYVRRALATPAGRIHATRAFGVYGSGVYGGGSSGSSTTLLHGLVSNDPPYDVVQSLVDLYPEALLAADVRGMTPLHAAVSFGAADVRVVEILAATTGGGEQQVESAAMYVKDREGRTPLHLAVMRACEHVEHARGGGDEEGKHAEAGAEAESAALAALSALFRLSSDPAALILDEDVYGISPIQLALMQCQRHDDGDGNNEGEEGATSAYGHSVVVELLKEEIGRALGEEDVQDEEQEHDYRRREEFNNHGGRSTMEQSALLQSFSKQDAAPPVTAAGRDLAVALPHLGKTATMPKLLDTSATATVTAQMNAQRRAEKPSVRVARAG